MTSRLPSTWERLSVHGQAGTTFPWTLASFLPLGITPQLTSLLPELSPGASYHLGTLPTPVQPLGHARCSFQPVLWLDDICCCISPFRNLPS